MVISKIKIILCVGCVFFVLSACSNTDPLLRPTGRAAFVPETGVEFTQYVRKSRENIEQILNKLRPGLEKRSYLGGYTDQEAAAMRSPFQVPEFDSDRCLDVSRGAGKGFLLIHGLTDSPYLMRSISDSLSREYPCALIRAVLLPGHGTIPGDSLKMRYKDWERIVDYGVNSFRKDKSISDLYLVGFSTGTSLIINYMKKTPVESGKLREDKIKGLVLLSVAVKAKSAVAGLAPMVAWVMDWATKFKERDAARYESFSFNAGAQFYELTQGMDGPEYALDVPVLMAVSADDATIDAEAARKFFCYPTDVKRRVLIWYQSIDPTVNSGINPKDTPGLMCDNIIEVGLADIKPGFKTLNLSHIAVSMSPEDPHYGVYGKYHNCKAYDKNKTVQEFNGCQTNKNNNIFGEKNVNGLKDSLHLNYDYLRRGTFNPFYKNLETKIFCFTNDNCPISELLESK
ncbi:MAG: esterase [Desulfobacteraceae bacterium]|nr:esterase [Desulfobacteraceae bacterium]